MRPLPRVARRWRPFQLAKPRSLVQLRQAPAQQRWPTRMVVVTTVKAFPLRNSQCHALYQPRYASSQRVTSSKTKFAMVDGGMICHLESWAAPSEHSRSAEARHGAYRDQREGDDQNNEQPQRFWCGLLLDLWPARCEQEENDGNIERHDRQPPGPVEAGQEDRND